MDIIGAHRQGLIEQLEEEVAALAGRAGDFTQRAIVLHHLYDHSRGGHLWALAEARRALSLSKGIDALRRRVEGWAWITGDREQARAALEQLSMAIGNVSRSRTIAVYRCYRASSTPALREEAEVALDPGLLHLLDQCHAARREGRELAGETLDQLAEQCERLAAGATGREALDSAWAAVEATGLRRAAARMLGDKALARQAAADRRRGAIKTERALRAHPALPASFRANPAQHFYALQRMLYERRRQQWREACDRVPDAFELAA